VRLVVEASDGSEAERARFLSGNAGKVAVVAPLPAAALGRMFGRDHVVHVAVAPGRLAERLHIEADRLAGLRGQALSGPRLAGCQGPGGQEKREQGQATAGLNE
jgi:hypothetical protein